MKKEYNLTTVTFIHQTSFRIKYVHKVINYLCSKITLEVRKTHKNPQTFFRVTTESQRALRTKEQNQEPEQEQEQEQTNRKQRTNK